MDIPRYVKVGPYRIVIEQHEGYFNQNDERVYGEYDERTLTINLDIDASADMIRDALLHEILHVILSMYDRDDETLVRLLSPMLLQVIKDNARLMLALST